MNAIPLAGGAGFDLARLGGIEIAGLTLDSRAAGPGYLFAALPGAKTSGVEFVAEAARRGAVAVLAPVGAIPDGTTSLPVIEDARPRRLFAQMAAAFYGAQPEKLVAVTGTSGKTSTVNFARQLWTMLGFSSASLGTLGVESDTINRYGSLTTADPVQLHADLAALAQAGVSRAAMEASSHGLDQYRLDGARVHAAGFTGFGRDHLDYHATEEAYFAAKARLFTEVLRPGGIAVLNADIPEFERLEAAATGAGRRVLSYGRRGKHLRIVARKPSSSGQVVEIGALGRSWAVTLPLVGEFQLMNALCALGLVIGCEFDDPLSPDLDRLGPMVDALAALKGVRGRLEQVARLANGAAVYVDYAHKPDALVAVMEALRPHTNGKLAVAFGCGGDRDPGKRPIMGAIAARLADRVIVTDDNPRSENPSAIRAAILAGAPDAIEIGDRAEAISAGIRGLDAGDVLVIAGKGHEQGQIVGDAVIPFDDAAVARAIVKEIAA